MLRRIVNKLSRILKNKDISQKLNFIKISKIYLSEYSQPKKSKGIFFCFYQSTLKPYALSLVLFKRLIKKKWSIVSLDDDLQILPKLNDKDLFEFYNKFYKEKIDTNYYKLNDHKKLNLKWKINHKKKECISLGINFYGTIMNLLSKEYGTYYPNLFDKKILNEFNNLVLTCDHCLYSCYNIEKFYRSKKIPIRISGFNTNYPPTSVFKLYCIKRGYKFNIHFIEIKQSYERLKNRLNEFVNAINIERISHEHKKRSSLLFSHRHYFQWLKNKKSNKEFLIADNSKQKFDKNTILDKISNLKKKKYIVYSVFLNVPIDIGHPYYDDGYIHRDHLDFVKNIIFEILKNKKNIIVIKKHPDTENSKLYNVKIDNLSNYLKKVRNKKVIFIDKHINNLNLFKLIDVSLIWRSNVGLETLARGIPTFFFSKHISFPFGNFFHINSASKFKKFLKKTPAVNKKTIEMSKFYMDYAVKNKIDYKIGKIPYKFHRKGYPIINLKKLNNFNIKEIDKKIKIDF